MFRLRPAWEMALLAGIAALYAGGVLIGRGWGLPGTADDVYLFPNSPPWPGARIAQLSGDLARTDAARGADVDASPRARLREPQHLNATPTATAGIYRRYRLFTAQPDEMIVMMALSGMDPARRQFDPRLYQYGGLFIYPVGGLVAVAGKLGMLDLHADPAYYLDHPEAFAAFYLVARGYAAAWGLGGVLLVWRITRRLSGAGAGLLAAGLFAVLPVVVAMSHEGKPHLPGAVLMLAATYLAMRWLESGRRRDLLGTGLACGAAVGMVLSAAPIIVLLPCVALLRALPGRTAATPRPASTTTWARPLTRAGLEILLGGGLAVATYLVTNPYIVINLLVNRAVLRSNFGNSLAMYAVTQAGEGLLRVLDLTLAGATAPVLILGLVALGTVLRRGSRRALPLVVAALVFAVQFVLLGAGKPDEYGRFGIFYEAALTIGAACTVAEVRRRARPLGRLLIGLTAGWCLYASAGYWWSFHVDAAGHGSRALAAQAMSAELLPSAQGQNAPAIGVAHEPAPYCCPPLNFAETDVWLIPDLAAWLTAGPASPEGAQAIPLLLIATGDDLPLIHDALAAGRGTGDAVGGPPPRLTVCAARLWWLPDSRISWANKPLVIVRRTAAAAVPVQPDQ